VIGSDRWEILERIGAYAASELSAEEARDVERLILEDPEALRLAESYLRMIALLGAIGDESPEVPEEVIDYVIRRAYVSAFLRQAEDFFVSVGRAYVAAFAYYLGLRRGEAGGPVGQGT
jgi:anti-sigma factor RsiW